MENKINIEKYFDKGTFVIPEYQRGYKWSVKDGDKESSLEFFLDSLIKAFVNELKEYFIEAVTVVEEIQNEEVKNIILVDGQQRTTSLFLLFAVLGEKEFLDGKLLYAVRDDSYKWLNNQIIEVDRLVEYSDEDPQDIFYFKKAIKVIIEKTKNIDVVEFSQFIKEKIYLLYNPIPKDKAVNTFIALNGLKAIMKDEELIKSDLLIKSSRMENIENLNDKDEQFGIEWKVNEDRGRLARNWDKWLYWWNQKKVRGFFGISKEQHPLYYLLVTYWNINCEEDSKTKDFSFDNFKTQFIDNSKNAKLHFEGLRKLQKTFEDFYNDNNSHNFLGLILKTSKSREESLCYFLDSNKINKVGLEDYAKWSLVEATHLEIINDTTEKNQIGDTEENEILTKKRKADDAIALINEKYVYWDENDLEINDRRKEYAFRFLLQLNVLEDSKLKRKFDFSIWGNRSLEHIYPKSKKNNLNFSQNELLEGGIHCIGNLVLLYGKNNSAFGAKDFNDKKLVYFNTSSDFQSRNLLHTISVFAKSEWNENGIIENKKSTINQLKTYYEL